MGLLAGTWIAEQEELKSQVQLMAARIELLPRCSIDEATDQYGQRCCERVVLLRFTGPGLPHPTVSVGRKTVKPVETDRGRRVDTPTSRVLHA